ncbi:type II toxin-antitoxin system HicA family toxin [Candidatus Poribacteria bacterium]|nr:type II toxin-antitoxin system HicA family toxin [Candidatus Poribacteria bacterium]
MRVISKRRFRQILRKLGFVENRGRDRIYFEYYFGGKEVVETKISHGGGQDISKRLLSHILRDQIYLTTREFEDMLSGRLSAEDYQKLLIERGIITERKRP